MMIVRDDYSRLTKVYFLRSQDDTADYFMKNLVNIAPRKVEMAMARSDDRSWVGGGGLWASLVPCVFEEKVSKSLRLPIPPN